MGYYNSYRDARYASFGSPGWVSRRKPRSRRGVWFLALSVFVFCASFLFFLSAALPAKQAHAAPGISETRASDAGEPEALYIVKTYMGKVGVFAPGSRDPLEVLDVWVSDLPDADRRQLLSGLALPTEESLQSLLEDYSS
ncbi:MAG: hypothetical protein FWE86_01975 [Oscillospiraceae bacterium]|nr:hypothetical protein [Oscillospiraceae bacterium]